MLRKSLLIASIPLVLTGCETLLQGAMSMGCALNARPVLRPESLPAGRMGEAYSVRLAVSDAPAPVLGIYVNDSQPLPPGLRIEHQERDDHGWISGTPTRPGSYEVHLVALTYGTQCAGRRAERTYRLQIAE